MLKPFFKALFAVVILQSSFLIAENDPFFSHKEDKKCESAYEPWYTGPLLAGSGRSLDWGQFNVQPYLFITNNYGRWDSTWTYRSEDDNIVLNPVMIAQAGLGYGFDLTVSGQLFYNEKKKQDSTQFGDTSLTLGFQFLDDTKCTWVPDARFAFSEAFPTGRYQNLNPKKDGTDISGAGSFETTFGLNLQKAFYPFKYHPFRFRYNISLTIPGRVQVRGFNAYGGGFGTEGEVNPGNVFSTILAFEFSLTQKWVLAMDTSFNHANKTSFKGKFGSKDGATASMGNGSSDQLSLAPAIEYNINDQGGFIGGVWVSVFGRNMKEFVSGVISFTYAF